MFRRILFGLLLAGIIACSAVTNGAVAKADPTLVGWWKFDDVKDGKVIDSSGKGNDGEIVGICSQTEGFVGSGALKITNGGMAIANSPLVDAPRFSIAMWVKWAQGQGALARLLQMGNDNKESMVILGGAGANDSAPSVNIVHFTMFADTGSFDVKAPEVFKGGTWRHIAAIYDGADLLLYIDGKVVAKHTVGEAKLFVAPAIDDSPMVIGCRPPNMDRTFNGIVDDVRMYNVGLSAQEVWELYAWKGKDRRIAALPEPSDRGTDLTPSQILSWTAGKDAAQHDVYFGADYESVANAKKSSSEFKGSQGGSSNTYNPGELEFGQTYFWRVDSVAKGAAQPKPAAADGLVGWWKCDDGAGETVADSSGNGNDGKVFGVTKWEAGNIGDGALKITNFQEGENLTSGGVVIPDSPELRPSRFTVAMWVKWPENFRQKAWNRILQKGNDNKETYVIIGGGGADDRGNADNGLCFAIAQETRGDVYSITAKEKIESGEWYHVAASYDGADMLLYLDGKVAGKKTIGDFKLIGVAGEPLVIGCRPPNMDRGFDGTVDDVRMYNKALSAGDIGKLSESKGGDANGKILKGDVWRFSTLAGKAVNPMPDALLKKVNTNTKLTWTASSFAKSHDVYFGDDFDKVTNAKKGSKAYKGTLGLGKESYNPGKLDEGKYYYWRVDENCAVGVAKGDIWKFRTKGGGLVIQLDLAVKTCDNKELYPGLAKPGWTIWASNAWADMYMHDYQIFPLKADGSGLDEGGIDGTGVTLWLTTGSEGQLGIGAKGICRDNLGGEGCPRGKAEGDPIANSWAYGVDWVGPYAGDMLLVIRNLPAGVYELNSYHNFWEPCTQSTRNCLNCICGMPPMPSVSANPLPSRLLSLDADGNPLPGKMAYRARLPEGTGKGVKSIQNAYNVAPQHVYKDSELVPSVIKFSTDGSDVLVIYQADRSEPLYPDCARKGREGARGILNAFELIEISK